MAIPVALPSFVQKRSMQGCNETEVSELIVAPKSLPFHSVAMMATPVGNVPMTDRKRVESIVVLRETALRFPRPGEDETGVFMPLTVSGLRLVAQRRDTVAHFRIM
jgi:hypothetical protein